LKGVHDALPKRPSLPGRPAAPPARWRA
jgi:hypothetical protein